MGAIPSNFFLFPIEIEGKLGYNIHRSGCIPINVDKYPI